MLYLSLDIGIPFFNAMWFSIIFYLSRLILLPAIDALFSNFFGAMLKRGIKYSHFFHVVTTAYGKQCFRPENAHLDWAWFHLFSPWDKLNCCQPKSGLRLPIFYRERVRDKCQENLKQGVCCCLITFFCTNKIHFQFSSVALLPLYSVYSSYNNIYSLPFYV